MSAGPTEPERVAMQPFIEGAAGRPGSGRQDQQGESMSDADTNQRIAECGKALAIACAKAMATGGPVNLPTMVAGCARMSGSYLLRSFNLDHAGVPPGGVVLSAQAGVKTPVLFRFCASVLQTLGTTIAASPQGSLEELGRKLKQDFLESQRILEPAFAPLKAQHGLDDEQMAKAAAIATGALIHQFSRHMDPNAGFGYAAFGFTEGARTAPLLPGTAPAHA
jgi:hypothetical protein